ncbi:heme O synthase, protoheme IX farnesyltransferase [Pseudanabaena sp. lw0831]|uniref:heme o synthase n=1 Tax=Pseudanabaena sp. lw0831 TaxID=1357935 RepID=UPI0019154672|nr:heme o synthase [Pseudanabaena sp. lw0831]GBO52571.1 heme O synthase, protoheme IX farnesyltransferase [Pseudanabaena sp. lw0831]
MQETAIQELNISETAIAENIFAKANQSSSRNWREVIQDYTELTKPRIIVLLLITTAGAMWIASEGKVDAFLMFITVLGGAIAAASANAINCLYDRDIDAKMERTSWRPIPSGRIQPLNALIFAIVLAIISFALLTVYANLLAACLAMSGIATYVGVYTIWLKRSSTQNIVIGGAAGAIPPLVGWAAVTGELSWAAWVLFAIIFVWTPPHFWALALMIRDEYAKVGVPMLPVVKGAEVTADQILLYTLLLVPVSLLLVYPCNVMGLVYALSAVGLGGAFIYKATKLLKEPSDRTVARSVFKYSILYLGLLCVAMGIDSLPVAHISGEQAISLLQTTIAILIP